MATLTKRIDPSFPGFSREVRWDNTEITAGDILNVNGSLGRDGQYLEVRVGVGGTITYRVNSVTTRYPPLEAAVAIGYPGKDLSKGAVVKNTSSPTFVVGASEVEKVVDFPINNVEVVSFTVGGGTGILIIAR